MHTSASRRFSDLNLPLTSAIAASEYDVSSDKRGVIMSGERDLIYGFFN